MIGVLFESGRGPSGKVSEGSLRSSKKASDRKGGSVRAHEKEKNKKKKKTKINPKR